MDSGEGVPLLGQEGWTRHQENAAKPSLKGAAGVVSSAKTSARRSDHPVCAASERDLFLNGAATPPVPGGEYPRLTIFAKPAPTSPAQQVWRTSRRQPRRSPGPRSAQRFPSRPATTWSSEKAS